jgi:ankyrin repeat protein
MAMRPLFLAAALMLAVAAPAAAAGNFLTGPEIVTMASQGDEGGVRAELLRGTSPNTTNASGESGLIAAAKAGYPAIARLFLQFKARSDIKDSGGNTALHWAARQNHYRVVEALLEAGADPDPTDKFGTTPLMLAAKNGNLDAVNVLLKHKADAAATDYSGRTALDFAEAARFAAVVRRLKQAGGR